MNPDELRALADALRLMVALRMDAITSGGRTTVYCRGLSATEYHGDDPYAATRRAIVRAAAALVAKEK